MPVTAGAHRVFLASLGCAKNLVDSEVMLGSLAEGGWAVTGVADDADAIIVNTCTFIDPAKVESVDAIMRYAAAKKPGQTLVVAGCMAQRSGHELRDLVPEIDAVVGTGAFPKIREVIEESRNGSRPVHLEDRDAYVERLGFLPRMVTTPRSTAYLKISEGCNHTCAFCIIPTLRGEYRSRPGDSIVREARALAARGVKELLLISQDTTFYGVDRHERGALARLLRELNNVDGLEWIRLLYLYPTTIDEDTLAAMAECDKVCKYIDLPLQHASNPVLKRMKRPGTRKGYDTLLARIRDRVPGVALRTTFIVGFPGETDADVEELCAFVSDHAFDHVGVFTYSHEEGTSAFQFDDDVTARTKSARRSRVMGLQKRLVQARQRARIGQRLRVLVDGPAAEHDLVLKGRLASQAPDIDASVFLTECDPSRYRAGNFTEVDIVGARGYDLIGRPVV
jgi:ribosomal protein S12 methylthiotransferase